MRTSTSCQPIIKMIRLIYLNTLGVSGMDRKTFLLALITVIIWSSAFPGIRASLLGGYTPGHLVLMRFLVASAVFLLYALLPNVHFNLPKKKHLLQIMVLSFIGISIYHASITYGQQTISAGTTGMIIGSIPIFIALIAVFVLKEKMSGISWVGLVIGFIGISMVSFGTADPGFTVDKGIFFVLIAALASAVFFVFQKPLFLLYKPIELMAYFTWFGTIPFLYFIPGFFETVQHATLEANISAIFVGIFPAAIAYALWGIALSLGNANTVATMLYIEPIFVIIIAWFWLKELPSTLSIIGGFVAISSVFFVNMVERSRQRQTTNEKREVVG